MQAHSDMHSDRVVEQFKEVVRTYMLRMLALSQQSTKFNLMHPLGELDAYFSKLLHLHQIKQSHIYELTNSDIKSDQHCLLLMTLLYDLAKWAIDTVGDITAVSRYCNEQANQPYPIKEVYLCRIEPTTVECIISQSMGIIKQEKKHQTLISKNNELIRILMQLIPTYLPVLIVKSRNLNQENRSSGEGIALNEAATRMYSHYTKLYDFMKGSKDLYGSPNKEEIKRNYNRAVQTSIKSLGNVVTLVILQTPYHLDPKASKNPHVLLLLQVMQEVVKYLEWMFNKVSQELYNIIEILNTVVLHNSNNIGSHNINNTVIPKEQVNSFNTEVTLLYGNNFGEVILSRLKILRLVLDVVAVIASMDLVQALSHAHHAPETSTLVEKLQYNQHILHKSAHLLIQINGYVKNSNYYIMSLVFSIYEKIMRLLLSRETVVPLYLYTHVVVGNLKLLMEWNKCTVSFGNPSPTNNGTSGILLIPNLHLHLSAYQGCLPQTQPQFNQLVLLQIILTQVSNLFNRKQLQYFLKLYDWNFMEEDICLSSIKYLYEFIDNSDNQGKPEYELFKKCLALINKKIQLFLETNAPDSQIKAEKKEEKFAPSLLIAAKKQRKQFYDLKKKQYLHLIEKINKKPKEIFKTIRQFNTNEQKEMKEDYIQKCVRIIKKSNHIEQRAMLDFMGANTPESEELLEKYIETFFKPRAQRNTTPINSSVEHFLRYIISNFFLAGEAQQIVRFIDKVTLQYFRHQTPLSNIFKNSDSVYTFANAIILLNADQHNPKNPNRMNLQSFMKMCEKINAGEALPAEIIRETYHNIRESEIHTFRNRYSIEKISLECWLDMVNDYETVGIGYYDEEMAEICAEEQGTRHASAGFKQFANQLLLSVIDEKQTQKLEVMIQRFEYDDRKFDCEIIEKIRQMIVNKKHIAMHALQKIYEEADFRNRKIDDKMLSYCWLANGIIQSFSEALPLSKVAEYLIRTWRVSFELKDNLLIRQNLEMKTIKKCLKQHKKKESKKSIMEMFSKFLSSKQSQNEDLEQVESPLSANSGTSTRKRANIANCSFNVFSILMRTKDSRARAAEAVLFSLRHEESRRFQQFVACLYLIFHFVYGEGNFESSDQQESENAINLDCIKILLSLLDDFYCLAEPHQIGSRIVSLKTKNFEKYELLYTYAQFWTLKILLSWSLHEMKVARQAKVVEGQKIRLIMSKCQSFITVISSDLLQQLLEIIDIDGLTFQKLESSLIPKELLEQFRVAAKNHSLQLKHLPINQQSVQPNNQKQKQKMGESNGDHSIKGSQPKGDVIGNDKKEEVSIEQEMKKQLGMVESETKPSVEEPEKQVDEAKAETKEQGEQEEAVDLIKEESTALGLAQAKYEEQKKSAKSNESGEQIGLPIYML